MGTVIITGDPDIVEFLDQFVGEGLDYSGEEFDNYYCINIRPFVCLGCKQIVAYAQCGNHLIIIWEHKDDTAILEVASYLKKASDMEPRIVRYNRILGPCIEYYKAVELGIIEDLAHGA